MNDLISVIVPIYKVEPYLKKCIDSIVNQTHKNLEIILVDDGSPDNCGVICDEYAKMDQRIRVIHKENGGLSDARNAGLDIMTGNYVGFVDSDDWIEPTMYETLLELQQNFDVDMVFGGVTDDLEIDGKVTSIKISNYGQTPFIESATDAMSRYFHGSWAAWDKLYKGELFSEIRYPVGEINEDEAIVLKLLHNSKKVCYTNEVLYHYMKRMDGTSITTADFNLKKLAWKEHCAQNLEFVRKNYPELEKDALFRYRLSLVWSINEIALRENKSEFKVERKILMKELCHNRKQFYEVPFENKKEFLRLSLIYICGLELYSKILRSIRRAKDKKEK